MQERRTAFRDEGLSPSKKREQPATLARDRSEMPTMVLDSSRRAGSHETDIKLLENKVKKL